ncbi:unnamed protein product, partial [Amoebophrya sp. A25]
KKSEVLLCGYSSFASPTTLRSIAQKLQGLGSEVYLKYDRDLHWVSSQKFAAEGPWRELLGVFPDI